MAISFLHHHPEFPDLIRIVAEEKGIDPALVEKDYWIMHCLFGLQQLGFTFALKCGTSLSKGHKIIDRFSEDIDIQINPPANRDVKIGPNQTKAAHIQSRREYYDWLAETIRIDGIEKVERDTAFDNKDFFSAGIRLIYKSLTKAVEGVKQGVLLEAGFDNVAPNTSKDISSWAYDHAVKSIEVIDNRAKEVSCYDPGYTLVEKLQTISTKFRQQQATGDFPANFMRHYYDVFSLLKNAEVQHFIGTKAYLDHKEERFRKADSRDIATNEAFVLSDPATRETYKKAYEISTALYYREKPTLEEVLTEIANWASRL